MDFVRSSGTDSWSFILAVVLLLVEGQDGRASVIRDSAGIVMEVDDPVRDGCYTFEQIGMLLFMLGDVQDPSRDS